MPDMTDAVAELVRDLRELYARMFADMATYAPDCIDRAADALEQQAREIAALRERVGEEIALFCENEPIHSWTGRILAERIRALTKSGK